MIGMPDTPVRVETHARQISYDQFCLRICTAQTANVSTALQCEQ